MAGGANRAPLVTFIPVGLISALIVDWPFAVLAAVGRLGTLIGIVASGEADLACRITHIPRRAFG